MNKKDFINHAEAIRERKHKHLVIVGSVMLICSAIFAEHITTLNYVEAFGLFFLMVADI